MENANFINRDEWWIKNILFTLVGISLIGLYKFYIVKIFTLYLQGQNKLLLLVSYVLTDLHCQSNETVVSKVGKKRSFALFTYTKLILW